MPLLKMAWGMWEICQQGHFPRCQWVQTRGWMLRGSADWCSCSTECRWYMQRVLAHSWSITVLVWCRYGHWLISAADSQYCITWILLIQQSVQITVLIKAEDTGKLTRILSYNTHTHTHSNMLKTATHNLWVHRVKVNVRCMQFSSFSSTKCGITGCNLGPKSYWRREEKKTKTCCCSWKQTALHCCREQPRRWCLETLSNRSTIICTLPVQRAANVIAESREV